MACNTSESVQKQLIALDSEANEAVKACLEHVEGPSPPVLGAGVGPNRPVSFKLLIDYSKVWRVGSG